MIAYSINRNWKKSFKDMINTCQKNCWSTTRISSPMLVWVLGDLCLYCDMVKNKNLPTYIHSVFEINDIKRSKYTLHPLFEYTSGTVIVNGDNIKPYNSSDLFEELPPKLRTLVGQCLNPESLKEQVRTKPDAIPEDFEN
jgi:hypothetical protein